MADPFLFKVLSKAGVKLDGTQLEGDYYTDALWSRIDRGRPRKMWGYRVSSALMHGPSRGLLLYAQDSDVSTLHNGWSDGIEVVQVDETGLALTPPVDRTPSGFVADPNNLWIMDAMYNLGDTNTAIIAVAPPSAITIANTTPGTIYYGDLNGTAALAELSPTDGPSTTAGGLFCMAHYLVVYDVAGYVTWSAPNEPDNFATADGGGGEAGARVAATKIVCGIPLRGGPGNSPAALLWSLNSLIRMSFNGGSTIFSFDTVSTDITVLSQKAIIESDGVYVWPGTDRFYIFNGVVRELPNELIRNWFFDNMNYQAHEKSFAFRNPRWGEIWFCFPYGNATECTHAAVWNYRYDTWYPTLLPNGGRSAGVQGQTLRYPMMMGAAEVNSGVGDFRLWQHEYGVDEVLDRPRDHERRAVLPSPRPMRFPDRPHRPVGLRHGFRQAASSRISFKRGARRDAGGAEVCDVDRDRPCHGAVRSCRIRPREPADLHRAVQEDGPHQPADVREQRRRRRLSAWRHALPHHA